MGINIPKIYLGLLGVKICTLYKLSIVSFLEYQIYYFKKLYKNNPCFIKEFIHILYHVKRKVNIGTEITHKKRKTKPFYWHYTYQQKYSANGA